MIPGSRPDSFAAKGRIPDPKKSKPSRPYSAPLGIRASIHRRAGVIRYNNKIRYKYHIWDQLRPWITITNPFPSIPAEKLPSRAISSIQA